MTCKCISLLNEAIQKETEDPKSHVVTRRCTQLDERPVGLHAVYRQKKGNGSFQLRGMTRQIVPIFCPWCGRPYLTAQERGELEEHGESEL